MKLNRDKLSNEAAVQFEIAYNLRLLNIGCALEYQITIPMKNRYKVSRFDIAIYNQQDDIVGIVECKSTKYLGNARIISTSLQLQKYKTHGIPVFLAIGLESVDEAINFAKTVMNINTDITEIQGKSDRQDIIEGVSETIKETAKIFNASKFSTNNNLGDD